MRLKFCILFTLVLPLTGIQQCTDETFAPVITSVEFPETMPGDGTETDGTVSFEDPDAGVILAYLNNVTCPEGGTCYGSVTDLEALDSDIPYQTSGIFPFYLVCNNNFGYDFYWEWEWILEDRQGNRSEPYVFGNTCVYTGGTDATASGGYAKLPQTSMFGLSSR